MANQRARRVGRPPGPAPEPSERRTLLLDAALRTIRRVGAGASMEEIATESGLSKPILYSYFHDKAGLASALAELFTAELTKAVVEPLAAGDEPRELVRAAIDGFVRFNPGRSGSKKAASAQSSTRPPDPLRDSRPSPRRPLR